MLWKIHRGGAASESQRMNQSIPEGEGCFRQGLQKHGNVRAFGLSRTLGSLVTLLCRVNVRGDRS